MFGCLKNFIQIIIVVLAVVGFFSLGGVTFFKDFFKNPFSQPQATKMEKSAEIANFSKLDLEFELVSSSKLPKLGNYVYVKHVASSQKFYFIKPMIKNILTKKDFEDKIIDKKITNFIDGFKILNLENFEITGRSTMRAFSQDIPYVKFKSDVLNLPVKGIQGIIGVASAEDENIIIVSTNTDGKYSQIITTALLKQLK